MMKATLTGVALALAVGGGAARATVIQLVDDGTVAGTPAEQGFEIAAAYWGSMLTNNVTVRIQVGYDSLGEGVIGQTGSASMNYSVANWEKGVGTTKSGYTLDTTEVVPTLTSNAIKMITSGPYSSKGGVNAAANKRVYDTDASTNNKTLDLNTANVKAIGGVAKYTGDYKAQKLDASITFSSNFDFDFNPTDGVDANSFDFIATAIHEMGHALGFVSGVDTYDVAAGYGSAGTYLFGNLNKQAVFSSLDLFRYSTDPTNIVPGTTPALDFSVGSPAYFSIDGGKTQLYGNSLFSTGAYKGDGSQASHWKDSPGCGSQLGIMDPTECYGQEGAVTALDLAAFDAIGWNLNFDLLKTGYFADTAAIYNQFAGSVGSSIARGGGAGGFGGFVSLSAVPEPATWLQTIVGVGLLGGVARRRRAAAPRAA